ncbi:hypothetical protein GCM10010503_20860 [Streptomyces lucensis JCM 4490]|uniref:Uncharacterized protein n=1 Tax=Streptomyces lucensis JCM 4490 TaxID=1306176 RepID=A0A918J257_9ACTN|nr:hypothetical protein [Streptomyces lucensis]GGW43997.1 hypothetical protein GCM10010503_20860 [Streptomyces lucensis JCM 4490]
MHVAPRATIELQSQDGLRSFQLVPEETFYLTRQVIAPDDEERGRFISRGPNCPQITFLAGRWMLLNESESRRVRVALPRGGYEEVGQGGAVRLNPGRTVLYFGPNGEIQVAVVIGPAAEPDEKAEARSGEKTDRGPDPTAQVERVLVQQSSRTVLVAVLAPWLSGDPALQDLKDRAVAAQCAGFSVGYVDKVLKEVRAELWPDTSARPSRAELADYFLIRGLLGAADVLALRHVACGHTRGR